MPARSFALLSVSSRSPRISATTISSFACRTLRQGCTSRNAPVPRPADRGTGRYRVCDRQRPGDLRHARADPFIVYTSNVFAILGLRSMYFMLAAAANRFVVSQGRSRRRAGPDRRQDHLEFWPAQGASACALPRGSLVVAGNSGPGRWRDPRLPLEDAAFCFEGKVISERFVECPFRAPVETCRLKVTNGAVARELPLVATLTIRRELDSLQAWDAN